VCVCVCVCDCNIRIGGADISGRMLKSPMFEQETC